jgi:hypothetical protein
MKTSFALLVFFALFLFLSCGLLEDTALDPMCFVECDIDGQGFRAQSNHKAFMRWFPNLQDQYEVTRQDLSSDFHFNLTLFKELGANNICTGTKVHIYLTDISLFMDGKTSPDLCLHGFSFCVYLFLF